MPLVWDVLLVGDAKAGAHRFRDTGAGWLQKYDVLGLRLGVLEVWPESHWSGFALRQADVFQSYEA